MAMTTWSLILLLLGETHMLEECVEDKIHKYINRVSEQEIVLCAQIQIQMKMSQRQKH